MSGSRVAGSHDHDHDHDHDHGHDHDQHGHDGHGHDHHHHGHDHPHPHDHTHDAETRAVTMAGDAEGHRAPLPRGAGLGKTLFLDTFSGIAGDMTIAALVDLGVPFEVVTESVALLGLSGFELELKRARGGAIGGTKFDVVLKGTQPDRRYRAIDEQLAASNLAPPVKALARRLFLRLAEAESEVHRSPLEAVSFHEVGAVDALVDIVGAAGCFEFLGAEVVSAPLPMGRGSVVCQHGVLPLPAPATVACLRGVPTVDAGIDAELVTPTGAAIVATVAQSYVAWPAFAPERIGWGFGTRGLPDRLNALRVVLGTRLPSSEEAVAPATHVVLEANVDDMSGELAAHALGSLLASGALDAWATPIVMKKGRPALTLSVIAPRAAESRLAELLLRETHSIGVRHTPVSRTERPRRLVQVVTEYGLIPLKISEGPYGPPRLKPEFDACAKAAEVAGVSVGVVLAAALAAYAR